MSKNLIAAVAVMGSAGAIVAGWLGMPTLQSARRTVQLETALQLERARRLLNQYDSALAYSTLLVDQLKQQGIEVDPDDLSEEVSDEYQQLHETMWSSYQPIDWLRDPPTPARARYGNLTGQIREGLRDHARLARDNLSLLDQAMAAIEQALAVGQGAESARSDAEANRLKAVILEHEGLAQWVEARLLRAEADRFRRQLSSLALESLQAASMTTLVADSQIDEEMDRQKDEAEKLEEIIQDQREELARLDQRIGGLTSRLAEAQSRAAQARKAMDQTRSTGIDFSTPDAVEHFRNRLEEQDRVYRDAVREAHALQHGTYPHAKMDPSGDYLRGRYLQDGQADDLTIEFGLEHYQNEDKVLAAEILSRMRALDDLHHDIDRFEKTRQSYESAQSEAQKKLSRIQTDAADAFDELNRAESEAFAMEETALQVLERAARSGGQASQFASHWITDAGQKTSTLSPEAKTRSAFQARTRDGWMSGYTATLEADARLAKAWIQYDRFQAATQNAKLFLQAQKTISLNEADADSERTKADQARDAGTKEIVQAMKILKRAYDKTGHQWTLTAQAAGTSYLLALFGHEDYVKDALDRYRDAIKGREDQPYAAAFVARINRLEKQAPSQP